MVASIRFADGSIGSLNYSTVGSKTSGGEQVEVFAQGIGVSTEDFKKLTIKTKMRKRRSRLWPDKGYASQLERFLKAVRTGEQPDVTVRDGARATVVCLRMLESARTQNPCVIDLESVLCNDRMRREN
jgi:predicted dehydrogenase